ncbi:Rap1a/Tai family immunity protein [Marinivivus vitaminiproducens]|uniref:Rap1a/Tai family immunity protein n=1 Tax=Marinivivus vitaminiproducens TaxID=3035935 RepID=UPI0027A43FE4|nr:Rap1a/Tai family immunity protein [Geminicoccaceae bacterium SCSIO 64248]
MFDIETTGDLAEICAPTTTDGESEAATFCYGYIVGAGQLYAEVIRAKSIEPIACPATVPTLDEIRTNFLTWSEANPQFAGERAIDGLMRSAAATWPCS